MNQFKYHSYPRLVLGKIFSSVRFVSGTNFKHVSIQWFDGLKGDECCEGNIIKLS